MPQVLHQRSVRHGREMMVRLRQTHSSTYPLISDPSELAPCRFATAMAGTTETPIPADTIAGIVEN